MNDTEIQRKVLDRIGRAMGTFSMLRSGDRDCEKLEIPSRRMRLKRTNFSGRLLVSLLPSAYGITGKRCRRMNKFGASILFAPRYPEKEIVGTK